MADRELLPCPFCGAGKTEVRENGRPWLGTRWGEPSSVSVRHWCEPVDGQPSRMIERVGRDRAAAIDAWNRRAALQSQDREDALTKLVAACPTNLRCDDFHHTKADRHMSNEACPPLARYIAALDHARRAEGGNHE